VPPCIVHRNAYVLLSRIYEYHGSKTQMNICVLPYPDLRVLMKKQHKHSQVNPGGRYMADCADEMCSDG
jgi:hypothetical protein